MLFDAQTDSFDKSLNLIVSNLIKSDEMEPYQDLHFESITISKLEIPEHNGDDTILDFDTDDDQVKALYFFRTSPPSSSSYYNRVFQVPRAVSRALILTSALYAFLLPFIIRFRDASGDDSWAKNVTQDDISKLVHPDEFIDIKSI
ncbi:hypothetical protein BGZ96_004780 [Linnemannia gamsii]|uniref:Uncharacterized protein n=1 Tax=Linnemannia gamsii TaxID=64522 RepID=A0ABQ7K6X8_9FUNG|nr:hypothetical protein BGZ96_004780 [Linnemannia gamsii]